MSKLLFLIALTLTACVAYVATLESKAQAGAESPNDGPYKCYQARHAKRSPRFMSQRVFLTDQFRDNVEVNVLKLTLHCSQATQQLIGTGSPAGEFNRGLDCYAMRDVAGQPRFQTQNIDVTDNKLGNQRLTLSKASSLCVPGVKAGKFTLHVEGGGFICYQAKTAKGQPRFQQRDIVIADQADEKQARVLRPVAYCSEADKKLDASNDNFEDATEIEQIPVAYHLSTVHATLESNDPPISCKTDYTHSVWFDWTSTQNVSLRIDTFGSSYDTVLAVFTGPKAQLSQSEVGCNDDVNRCSLVFDGVQSAGCDCTGDAGVAGCPCELVASVAGECCPVATQTGATAGCPPLTSSFLQIDAWANTTYHILVGSSDGHGGKLKFRVLQKGEDTAADSCANPFSLGSIDNIGSQSFVHLSTMDKTFAEGVSAGAEVAGSGPCNTNADPDLSCFDNYGASVWFTYTPDAHQIVTFETSSSSYPTVIGVFDTTLGGDEVACNASGDATATMKSGRKYLIMVGSSDFANNYQGGKLKLLVTLKDQLLFDGQSAGVDTQVVSNGMVCYQVRQARHGKLVEEVLDQFSRRQLDEFDGTWLLSIGGVNSICLPVVKSTCTRYVELVNLGEEGEAARLCITT